jgi:hypothetical protein
LRAESGDFIAYGIFHQAARLDIRGIASMPSCHLKPVVKRARRVFHFTSDNAQPGVGEKLREFGFG